MLDHLARILQGILRLFFCCNAEMLAENHNSASRSVKWVIFLLLIYIEQSSASIFEGKSFTYNIHKRGPMIEPCGNASFEISPV